MNWSLKYFSDWKAAKAKRVMVQSGGLSSRSAMVLRWLPPNVGCFKLDVDVSFIPNSDSFSMGLPTYPKSYGGCGSRQGSSFTGGL